MIIVKSIAYKPEGESAPRDQVGYLRRPVREAMLIAGYGIEGDRKGGHPKRNLNVMDDLTQAELAAEGYPTGAGTLGENIILSGVDLRTLPEATQLQIGGKAVIALGKLREPCEQLTPLDDRMPQSVEGRIGAMCRVLKSGRIKVGDPVMVLTVQTEPLYE
jgi:MOSC domain-containing protein YiiM